MSKPLGVRKGRALGLSSYVIVGILLIVPATLGQQQTDEAVASSERVWSGYLFRDREKGVQLGWAVVAMGVMAEPSHLVEPRLAARLDAFVAPDVGGNWFFLNSQLGDNGKDGLARTPRYLLKLAGREVVEPDEGPVEYFPPRGDRWLRDARLVAVEHLPEAWLRSWSTFFSDRRSPFRIDTDRPQPGTKELVGFAPVALKKLTAMRAVPGPSKELVTRVRDIDSEARVVETFRRRTEWGLQRWLLDLGPRHDLKLEGLEALGPLPPTSLEIQRWFLESPDRAIFLGRVPAAWRERLDDLELVHYVEVGGGSSYATTEVADVRDRWTADTYRQNRETTRKILGR